MFHPSALYCGHNGSPCPGKCLLCQGSCVLAKKKHTRLCLSHPLPPRGVGALLGGAGTRPFPQLEAMLSLQKRPCVSVGVIIRQLLPTQLPVVWRCLPWPQFLPTLPSRGNRLFRCRTFLILARHLLVFGSYIPLGAPLGSQLFILE